MSFFTIEQIEQWMHDKGFSQTANSAKKAQLLGRCDGIVKRFENCMNRKITYNANIVEYVEAKSKTLYLNTYPIENIEEIRGQDSDGSFSGTDPVPSTNYTVNDDDGVVRLSWAPTAGQFRIMYSAGYNNFGNEDNGLPYDLAEAILTQLVFDIKNQENIGVVSQTNAVGTITKYAAYGIMPGIKAEVLYYYTNGDMI